MRLISVLSAVLVTVTLYLFVLERTALIAFAKTGDIQALVAVAYPADTTNSSAKKSPLNENCHGPEKAAEMDSPQENRVQPVKIVAMRSQAAMVNTAVILRGRTEAARQVNVMAETTGKVISVPLRKGSLVTQGQQLCQLDPGTRMANLADARARLAVARTRIPEAKASQDEAQARLNEAKINNNGVLKLSAGGFAPETRVATTQAGVRAAEALVQGAKSGLDSARAGIQSAEATVATKEREIDRLTITAPFEGLLETDTAEFGSLMQANGPSGGHCATIIQLDPIKLVGYVPETEVNKVILEAQAGARLAAGGQDVTGLVSFISRSADPNTPTFRVEIQVPNPDLRLRDGQTAEILISTDGAKAHLIPQSALTLNDEGQLGVRLVDDNSQAQFQIVKILRDTEDGVLLTGLPNSTVVILVGQEYVIDDVPVAVTYSKISQ